MMSFFVFLFLNLFNLNLNAALLEDLYVEDSISEPEWIGEYEVWSKTSENRFEKSNDCLSQLIIQSDLTNIERLSIFKSHSQVYIHFENIQNKETGFSNLNRVCNGSICVLNPNSTKNTYFERSVIFGQGMSRHIRMDLFPSAQRGWYFNIRHELKILGIIKTNEFAQSCYLKKI